MSLDTCVAFATAPGPAGMAVLRFSGPEARELSDRIFRAGSCRPPEELRDGSFSSSRRLSRLEGYQALFGHVYHPRTGVLIDQAVALCFRAPHSYTGEDVVEISVHGSAIVKEQLLAAALAAGARMAGPGEFTQRAFLNGKMDLTQAEAVIDLIEAEAEAQAVQALQQVEGRLSDEIRKIRLPLLDIRARIELGLQYPEHEESYVDVESIRATVSEALRAAQHFISGYREGSLRREGLYLTLAGRPNAGKSSLLNRFLGEERAIVTPLAGTTRDSLTERFRLGPYLVHVTDTAGLRETEDEIERLGVERSRAQVRKADLVLWLFAADSEDWEAELAEWAEALRQQKQVLPLLSKTDLLNQTELDLCKQRLSKRLGQRIVCLSQQEEEGYRELLQEIKRLFEEGRGSQSQQVLLNSERQLAAMQRCEEQLQAIVEEVEVLPYDLVSLRLEAAAEALAEITGENVNDEVWKEIFSRFCVGK